MDETRFINHTWGGPPSGGPSPKPGPVGPDSTRDEIAEGSRELKFALPNSRADAARRWLDSMCQRDPQFPAAVVSTIYYDTPDLTSLYEKINSDYLKRKIRLRWYSNVAGEPLGPAFIEAKSRVGTRRSKIRVQAPYTAEDLAAWNLQDPRLQPLPLLLTGNGTIVGDLWQPLMLVRYRRDRFVEPVSRSRVSLDAEIAAAAVNRRFLSGCDDSAMDAAVLEVKGVHEQLPLALRPLVQLGAQKCSFSKFLAVYLHATHRVL